MDLIDSLVANMTLAEKIGQLNMVTAGQAITGPVGDGDLDENLRAGNIGSVLNLWGREATSALQKIALEETRLGPVIN
jgi:beta-glucosidase